MFCCFVQLILPITHYPYDHRVGKYNARRLAAAQLAADRRRRYDVGNTNEYEGDTRRRTYAYNSRSMEAALEYVLAYGKKGDVDSVIQALDTFAWYVIIKNIYVCMYV